MSIKSSLSVGRDDSGVYSITDSDSEELMYEVETVLRKRTVRGRVEYLLKWRGYGNNENSWEPEGNLTPDAIQKWEEDQGAAIKKKKAEREGKEREKETKTMKGMKREVTGSKQIISNKKTPGDGEAVVGLQAANTEEDSIPIRKPILYFGGCPHLRLRKQSGTYTYMKMHGFQRGFKPEEIIGATVCCEEDMFLIKWKGVNLVDSVPQWEAKARNDCIQIIIEFYLKNITWVESNPE